MDDNYRHEYVDGLRQIADLLESHPEIDLPTTEIPCYTMYNKEIAAKVARALSDNGRCNKVYTDGTLSLQRSFGPVLLAYYGVRSNLCEQVKVGTRIVPEKYVPPQPAVEGHTIPEREEAIYEWQCGSLLGKPSVETPEELPAITDGESSVLEAEYVDIPF